jgi:hypothetical protein
MPLSNITDMRAPLPPQYGMLNSTVSATYIYRYQTCLQTLILTYALLSSLQYGMLNSTVSVCYIHMPLPNMQTLPLTYAPLSSLHSMACLTAQSVCYIFGGRNSAGTLLNDLWTFDFLSMAWLLTPPRLGESPSPRMHFAMFAVSNYIYTHIQVHIHTHAGTNTYTTSKS